MLVYERKDEISHQIATAEDWNHISCGDTVIRQIPCQCDIGFGEETQYHKRYHRKKHGFQQVVMFPDDKFDDPADYQEPSDYQRAP